jgi:hypothetical protein
MRITSTTIGRATLGAALGLMVASHAADARADEAGAPAGQTAAPAAAPAKPAGPAMPTAGKTNPAGINDEARSHFAAGVSLLQDPEGEKVEEAYREFRTAYDISGSPKILGNMGFCAMRLERDGEAIDAYTRYLREVPDIDAEERAQIVRDLQTLTIGLARLTIEVNKPGVRIVDVRIPVRGERVTNTYGPITNGKLEVGVRPGHHILTAKLTDHEDATWEIDAFAASRDKNAFVMRPRVVATPGGSDAGRSSNVGPIVVMGIGGAMLVGGAITGILALGKSHDIEDKCPNDVCPKSFNLDSERSSAKTFVRVTDVLLIGGGLVTLGGLGWLLLADGGKTEKEPPKSAGVPRPWVPVPSGGCGPDGCRASMKVVF